MVKSLSWIKVCEFDGMPKLSDFKIVEEEIDPALKDGEILTRAMSISVDPFNRGHKLEPNNVMMGFQTARVLKSKHPMYPEGSHVCTAGGWKTICKLDGNNRMLIWSKLDEIQGDLADSLFLGSLGMPGMTAYFGFQTICQPKKGETVMVTGCAGAVGSLVGQIAKIHGCRVIGSCGSDEKVAWVKSIGFDDAFNYKTEKSWPEALKRMAPKGIDCFFDNVGGEMMVTILQQMNEFGRISVCGAISVYNDKIEPSVPIQTGYLALKQLKIEGFIVTRWMDELHEVIKQMATWVKEGKINARETVTEGFENIPKALIGMMKGENIGKAVVKIPTPLL